LLSTDQEPNRFVRAKPNNPFQAPLPGWNSKTNPGEESNERNVLAGLAAERIKPLTQQSLGNLHAANAKPAAIVRLGSPNLTPVVRESKPAYSFGH
jgi:hypothetical protein